MDGKSREQSRSGTAPDITRAAPAAEDGPGHIWFIRADCQIRDTRRRIWPPVGANQSQRPAPLGQRTVFNRFGGVLLHRAKNLIACPSRSSRDSSVDLFVTLEE